MSSSGAIYADLQLYIIHQHPTGVPLNSLHIGVALASQQQWNQGVKIVLRIGVRFVLVLRNTPPPPPNVPTLHCMVIHIICGVVEVVGSIYGSRQQLWAIMKIPHCIWVHPNRITQQQGWKSRWMICSGMSRGARHVLRMIWGYRTSCNTILGTKTVRLTN